MKISMYKKTGLFFGLSTLIPWTLWLSAGYLSHSESSNAIVQKWVSIIAFMGLLAPVIVTLFLARGNSAMQRDLRARLFNFKDIKSTYIVLTIILMPLSILMAQAVSLLFGFSIEQFQLAGSFSFYIRYFLCLVFIDHCPAVGGAGVAFIWYRCTAIEVLPFYYLHDLRTFLGNLAFTMRKHQRFLPQQFAQRRMDLLPQLFAQPIPICNYHELDLLQSKAKHCLTYSFSHFGWIF